MLALGFFILSCPIDDPESIVKGTRGEKTEIRYLGDVENCGSLVADSNDVVGNTGYITDAAEDC